VKLAAAILLAALLPVALAAGCDRSPPREAAAPADDDPTARARTARAGAAGAREARAQEIVATVDGEPIYGAEIEPPGAPRDESALAVARERYLENAITRRLFRREAARLGLTDRLGAGDEPALFAALRAQEVADKLVVTEDELQAEFASSSARYPRRPRVHLRQLAIPLGPDATAAQVEAESRRLRDRAAAELVRAPAPGGAAPIDEIGVDLGWLEYQQGDEGMGDGILADPALRAVAASLAPGAASAVVRGPSGLHVLLCVAQEPGGPPTFDSARSRVEAVVRARRLAQAEADWLATLRARYNVAAP
jgi:parvulin-like peptidyl-prolyl isomerase